MPASRVFLLSPAFCGGRRAKILLRDGSDAAIARRLQAGTLTLGDAFAFLSGLYFRGKLAYGRAFGRRADAGPATLVITPSRGLMDVEAIVDAALLHEFAAVDVALDNPRYREPLDRDAAALAAHVGSEASIVLLGSVASGKYGDALAPWFGDRLLFPTDFVGRGDMSRGGLLLRRAASGEELAYACLRCGDRPTGARPPKLPRATILLAGLAIFCAPAPAPPPPAPAVLHDCTIGGVAASCGSIPVFENRATRRGRQIDVHFDVVRSRAPAHQQAVFAFAGGPGEGSMAMTFLAGGWMAPLLTTTDLVFVDQRGTGQSHPLSCEPVTMAHPAETFGHVFDPAEVRGCRDALEKIADLTRYSTDDAVADIDDVRAALGYETIGLYGGSYGTRVAQTYMRRYPSHTRVAVLDGVLPVDVVGPLTYAASAQQSLERVFKACALDPLCFLPHPNPARDFDAALRRFDAGPIPAIVRDEDGAAVPVTMTRGDFGYAVRGLLYRPGVTRRLADLIGEAAATGRVDGLAQAYAERAAGLSPSLALGLHLSVLCAEDVAFATDDEIARATASTFLGSYLFDEYRAACREWPRARIAADARTPVTTPVPTLLVSGWFDPVTPPEFAVRVARSLPRAARIDAPDGSHVSASGCPRDVVLRDLETGSIDWSSDSCSSRPGAGR